jgi:hypothetical protein
MFHTNFLFFLLSAFVLSNTTKAQENLIKTSLAADIVFQSSDENTAQNRLLLRSAEMSFSGNVDPFIGGKLSLAAHEEEGAYNFEVHEAFFEVNGLIPNSNFRVGKFFLNIGKLNTTHQHDWSFTNAPKMHQTFLDEEGVADLGGEYTWLVPSEKYISLTFGLTNGFNWGHTHVAGQKPLVPVHYVHPQIYWLNNSKGGLLTGFTYLGRTDHNDNKFTLVGIDNTYKQRVGKIVDWLVSSEIWLQNKADSVGVKTDQLGAYLFVEKNFTDKWYLGARLDGFSNLSQTFVSGPKQNNLDYDITTQATARFSEFSLLRLSYTYKVQSDQGESDLNENHIAAQFTFIMGDHPSHDY